MIFKTPPADFNKEVDVVGCYVEHSGRFVLLHRNENKRFGNQFGLPAGKVDAGESIHEAMQREILEETGIEVQEKDLKHFDSVYVRGGGSDIIYHMFFVLLDDKPEIVLSPAEHQAFLWVSPKEALELDLIHDLDECIKVFYKI